MRTRSHLIVTIGAGLVGLGALAAGGRVQDQPPPTTKPQQVFPDLVGALKATDGCLGVELARTQSGMNLIFAWFKDKKAMMTWYYSERHQQIMDQLFVHDDENDSHKPLEGIGDDFGPIMVIASVTMADESKFDETRLPISQIAIELYAPISGGLFLGGRFAPKGVTVPKMHDYTPKSRTKDPD
ncbi:MAG: hypothetical protein IH983_07795 [Planctomycetes bacterium]|nr:hypothetical protein [Planctomycetota bacterium]